MTAMRITTFQGIRPRTNPRLIGDTQSRAADNCDLQSGTLAPLRRPYHLYSPSKPLPALAIYKAVEGVSSAWLTWPFDVDVAKFPMPSGVAARFGWTGDGEPRWGKFADLINGGGNDYPHQFYALGIPNPTAVLTVTPTGGVSATTVTRFYVSTYFSQGGEESGASPVSVAASGKVDASWAVAGMSALPTSSGTGTAAYASGETTFTNGSSAPTWLRVGDEVVIAGATVKVTATPSPASFKVAGDYNTATTWARKAPWNTSGMKMRLYRTAGTAAGFQLVTDNVLASGSYSAGTNTYTDTLSDAAIMGDNLISDGWKPPPAGLRGLIVTGSGALAGFVGSELRLSVPQQGHAWPDSNSYQAAPEIVAIAPMGSAVGVGTVGVPHVLIGSDPSAMALIPANVPYPCLSKRSMVSDGAGVLYASNAGMVRLDQSAQPQVFSEPWFDPKTWALKVPASMVCAVAPGKLYAIYTANSRTSIMVWDTVIGELTETAIEASDIYVDEATGEAYVSDALGVSAMNGGTYTMQLVWRSKEYMLPKPINFGAAKVLFSAAIDEATLASILADIAATTAFNASIVSLGKLGGSFNQSGYNVRRYNGSLLKAVPEVPPSNSVTFTLFTDGNERCTRTVTSDAVFRLPSGYLSGRVSVQVSSACEINGIEMANNPSELEQT